MKTSTIELTLGDTTDAPVENFRLYLKEQNVPYSNLGGISSTSEDGDLQVIIQITIRDFDAPKVIEILIEEFYYDEPLTWEALKDGIEQPAEPTTRVQVELEDQTKKPLKHFMKQLGKADIEYNDMKLMGRRRDDGFLEETAQFTIPNSDADKLLDLLINHWDYPRTVILMELASRATTPVELPIPTEATKPIPHIPTRQEILITLHQIAKGIGSLPPALVDYLKDTGLGVDNLIDAYTEQEA